MNRQADASSITVDLDSLPKPTDLGGLFAQPAPVELEVGIGKGGFLLEQARLRPDVNFLGIEWANEFYRYASDRFARWGLTNVRVLRTDARAFIAAWLAPGCLSAVHVYFPDPWPKTRHHKRRLFNPTTVEAVLRALAPAGRLYLATDHAEYFEVIQSLLGSHLGLAAIEFPVWRAESGEIVGTNFERKYIKEGRTFYKLAFQKR